MSDIFAQATALRALIQSAPVATSREAMAEALVSCCSGLVEAGEPQLALGLIADAGELTSHVSQDWALRLGSVHAQGLLRSGRPVEALALVRDLKTRHGSLTPVGSDEAIQLRITEASILWWLSRAREAVQILLEVRSQLLAKPDSHLLAWCVQQLAAAENVAGNFEDARDYALEAIVSARRCGARVIEALALGSLGRLERSRCRWSNAEEAIRAALAIFEREGNRTRACEMHQSLGIVLWRRGRLADGLECTERAITEGGGSRRGWLQWYGNLLKGMILLHVGDNAQAVELFTSGTTWDVPGTHVRPSLLTTEFLGDVHLEQGQAEEALRHYDDVWPKALALVPKGDIVAELRRRRAECYLLLGRAAEAYEEAQTGLAHCRELGDRYEEAATYRVLALAAAAIGKPQEAKQHFTQGFAYYDDIETPYEWGKLWMAYGDWLRGPHAAEYADHRGALEAYHAARDHFERMGAQAKLTEVSARIAEHAASLGHGHAVGFGHGYAPDPRPEHATPRPPGPMSPAGAPGPDIQHRRPQRRPRGAAELDRRARWASETFGLVTRHPHLLAMLEDVAKLARGSAPILVLGESGTGKELIAAGIHRLSVRRGQYMPLNSSAVPREVMENELFGHVAGGFTGATQGKAGLFEVCDGGTVFLDEVGEMPLELQAKLLRFLESGELRRVGATRNVAVDTRVVAATNRERGALERGEGLRKDLYYRLAHAVVELPALRHRGEDVELLTDHFLAEACAEEEKQVTLSAAARRRLLTYAWPGNVRQMKAVLRRVVTLTAPGHAIGAAELKLEDTSVPTTLLEELGEAEKRRVAEVLRQVGGSRTEAAKLLGVPRTTLLNKMRRYGLS